MFRGYDLRGLVGKDLNEEVAEHIGMAYGTFLSRRGIKKAVVGRDSRPTSSQYGAGIIRGLNWAGVDTIDIGLNLIGTFYWAQYCLDCRAGIYVSASHNSAEYNGFKFAIDFSETLVSDGMQALRRMLEEDDYEKGGRVGEQLHRDVRDAYYADLLKRIPLKKKFRIVVDPGGSTAGEMAPQLLGLAGAEVVKKNCALDPLFSLGTPDPTDIKVAERLSREVLQAKADIGFSYDADGDRIGVVDEKGTILWNDILVALFAADVLLEHPGAIIMYNTLCSRAVEETILRHGGKPFMWRTGHSFLKKKNQEIGAAFIGELSGHFFFSADFYNHDDGLYSTMRLLWYLEKNKLSLSEAIAVFPKYISSPEIKIFCPDDKKAKLIQDLAPILEEDFPDGRIVSDERAGDGARIDFEDAMFVVRYSQNGPYLTLKFEAKNRERYDFLRKYISELLHRYEEIDWASAINVNTDVLTIG
ncbi:MAG: hypothetical protein A3D59_00475 [Candidatus Wildermuthbacteria bacterium RIFCSPHIGHO2_02_FULL_47_17]|uniref:Phosphomannomutase n=1 Tax=Candidatus Wildermuthbacteria bacterium RIFCSPHIGHO2_02_FULL_47_17 TaxID=1802452 RepID=A0A1G2R7V7_9BACT|nr:MAG: hypothetical protein A3D59_00475 [Candidatus Wildermuthbacteria bacterium RIFCSPHIGHO2_02_FULL_47_17]